MKRTVADLMTADPASVHPDSTLEEVRRIMYRLRVRHVPVVDTEGVLVGVISMTDLLQRMRPDVQSVHREEDPLEDMQARDLMANVVSAVPHWTVLSQAARRLLSEKRSALPIVDADHKLVGILTEADFVRVVAEMLEEDEALEDEFTDVIHRRPET